MKEIINNLEYVIDDIEVKLCNSLDRDEICMLTRAMQEATATLTTLKYINQ
jgi:hypothetical protein